MWDTVSILMSIESYRRLVILLVEVALGSPDYWGVRTHKWDGILLHLLAEKHRTPRHKQTDKPNYKKRRQSWNSSRGNTGILSFADHLYGQKPILHNRASEIHFSGIVPLLCTKDTQLTASLTTCCQALHSNRKHLKQCFSQLLSYSFTSFWLWLPLQAVAFGQTSSSAGGGIRCLRNRAQQTAKWHRDQMSPAKVKREL